MPNLTSLHLNKKTPLFSNLVLGVALLLGLTGCGGGDSSPLELSINDPVVLEGDSGETTEMVFTVTLSEDASRTLTAQYTTVDVTATEAGNDYDYTAASGTVTIAAGSRSANITIYVRGDDDLEAHETLTLQLSNPQGVEVTDSSKTLTATGTITNDEAVDPKGYYRGSATLNGTDYGDITALIYDSRILLFSPTANVLYDITLNNPDSLDYEGTVDLYVDGLIAQADSITVSGQTDNNTLSGTFSGGTELGDGSFEVAFDSGNNVGATLARIEAITPNLWAGNLYGIDKDEGRFFSDELGNYIGVDSHDDFCSFPNSTPATLVVPEIDTNIYLMAHPIEYQGAGDCDITYASTGHTGFAVVVDDGDTSNTRVDDKLLFAFDNGDIALFGIMYRP